MSRVPTAVRQQAQSVDDMIRANKAASEGVDPADLAAVVTDPQAEPNALAPTADVVPIDTVPSAIPPDDPAAPATTTMQEVALQSLDATAAEVEEYKQRWKSLDGQLRQRDAQLAQQAEQIARLTDLVGNMAEGQAQAPAEPLAPAGVLASDGEDFGDDMVVFVTRVAEAVVARAMAGVQTQVATLEHNVADVTQSTAAVVKKSFQEELTEKCPRWREFDTAQPFHDWLGLSETRHNAFYASVTNKDAVGVADYFNMYVSTLPPPQVDPQVTAQQRLEAQVAPPKSTTAPTADANQTEPKIWTRTEIALNYKARQNRKIDDATWGPLEKEMTAAQNTGRVDYER